MSAAWSVEVINTGTELLFGSVVNTHLAYLGQQLFSLGLRVDRQTTVPDGLAIADAIRAATSRSGRPACPRAGCAWSRASIAR